MREMKQMGTLARDTEASGAVGALLAGRAVLRP